MLFSHIIPTVILCIPGALSSYLYHLTGFRIFSPVVFYTSVSALCFVIVPVASFINSSILAKTCKDPSVAGFAYLPFLFASGFSVLIGVSLIGGRFTSSVLTSIITVAANRGLISEFTQNFRF